MKKISLTETEVNELLDLYQSEIDRAQRRISNLKTIIRKLSEGGTIESSNDKPVKVKLKRGRKPKAKNTEAKVVIENKEVKKVKDEAIAQEPKKRGRKKKIVEIEAEPKKRGRKKKIVIPKAAPKKKGRKPKSLRKPIKGGKGENKVKWNDFIIDTISAKNSLMLASSLTQAALEKFQIPASDRDRVRMAISTTLTKMANKDNVLKTHTEKGIRGAFFGLPIWYNDKGKLSSEYKKKLM